MASYPLLGGPCDGQRSPNFTAEPATGTTVACGGAAYRYDRGNPGVFIWLDTGPGGGGGGGIPTADKKQIGRSWGKLMHVLGVEAPHSIRRARAARARLKRLSR